MHCPRCQHANRDTAKFCEECGTRLLHHCFDCGHHVSPRAKFCEECGTPLMPSTSPASSVQPRQHEIESESRLQALLPVVTWLLRGEGRVTYRTLKYVFGVGNALLAEICEELFLRKTAIDEGGKVLVWTGVPPITANPATTIASQPTTAEAMAVPSQTIPAPPPLVTPSNGPAASSEDAQIHVPSAESIVGPESVHSAADAERRQLTVMFCDLVGSTDLSGRLDPEDLREVVRAYQETAAEVIARYEGHIAQYLGDGLLIYFGYPAAHEDDAQRAVHTGLGIVEAMNTLNACLEADYSVALAVRVGIHTGPVVVGEMGSVGRHEHLALGETPNIASRLEGFAQANAVVISSVTAQLVQRSFALEELGLHELKGVSEPLMLYAVVGSREVDHDDHESMMAGGFDALVGRDEEIGLLLRRWEQSKDGQGQVVLISGEAGLGKSSLVEGLRAYVHQEGHTRITFRCSPYTANSAMHPVIEHVQRVLGWQRDDSVGVKLDKLEQALHRTNLPMEETVPLLAALLSLPVSEDRYPTLTFSPQRQRQLTQDALVAWMLEEAERQPVLAVWEDVHWADPSTLELLGLFIDQVPTVPMLHVLAFRPEFVPPWPTQSHMTPLVLNRLERAHIETLVRRLAGGKMLPSEVETHIVTKTDGVPLYVEELTKMLLESDLLDEHAEQYVLTGRLASAAIPDSLQSSLMMRLDRLPEVREVAQLGAVLGREFDYEMLQASMVMDEATLQKGLSQLVNHELLYQRGRIPRATFIFRHALIRDAAYASLLRRTRQQYHKQVAETLQERFPGTVETQPELLAYHYTEAGCHVQAVTFWLIAGQRAVQRSAHAEGIRHLQQGLEGLTMLPESPERAQHELTLQTTLATALLITKGYRSPEAKQAYSRARELCVRVGETRELPSVLLGLWLYYAAQGDHQSAREFGEQVLRLGRDTQEPVTLIMGHFALGLTLQWLGELRHARAHFEELFALYDTDQHHTVLIRANGVDIGLVTMAFYGWVLWMLGYPDQARHQSAQALALAQSVSHPHSLARVLDRCLYERQCRREPQRVLEHAKAAITLATERGYAQVLADAPIIQGWALAMQGQGEKGIAQIHQTLAANRATGTFNQFPQYLCLLAESYGATGQVGEGLAALDEALALANQTPMRFYEAEVYRLKGQLLLQQSPDNAAEVESCFQKAMTIAQNQSTKSWELRAATSLARLWQSQGKRDEAHELLEPVYSWFTEGFDTADLIDAKALLDELSEGRP